MRDLFGRLPGLVFYVGRWGDVPVVGRETYVVTPMFSVSTDSSRRRPTPTALRSRVVHTDVP
jgi:hypothetical protein